MDLFAQLRAALDDRYRGDTTWVTDAVIRAYTGGQTADMRGSIDAFHRMSKSKERESLASRLHELDVPVRLLIGSAPWSGSTKHHAETYRFSAVSLARPSRASVT
jgi:hypothetical protein